MSIITTSQNNNLINIANVFETDETFFGQEEDTISFGENEDKDLYNYINDTIVTNSNEDRDLYDWIANSASTSHICNKREVFTEYLPVHAKIPIFGVGGITTCTLGRGKVKIETIYDNKIHTITLSNVLYVPTNHYNLLSLGRWAHASGTFKGGTNMSLISPNNTTIAKGTLISNNLYKIAFKYSLNSDTEQRQFAFVTDMLTRKTWHQHFGHVSYTGLSRLHAQNLVHGFTVDTTSQKSDCSICTAAKHSKKPFGPPTKRASQPGELTHANLWGKYDITSIHGCQYYLLLIDDATCYITVKFLKTKNQARQQIKNYFSHLSM